jgi:uncharacterized protein (TIGR03435 family)
VPRFRQHLRHFLFLAITSGIALSQTARPEFEVASIKPNAGSESGTSIRLSPGLLTVENFTTQLLLQRAYHVESFQISGAPGWVNSDRFDIAAKATGNLTSEQALGQMLQALLEERFQLKLHLEMHELPVYNLTTAKKGLKLSKSACEPFDTAHLPPPPKPGEKPLYICGSASERASGLNWTLNATGMSMPELARNLSQRLGRTVVDQTSITGIFDIHLTYERERTADADSPSVFSALQEQLGLKLESSKGPVEILVIDHVAKPSAN